MFHHSLVRLRVLVTLATVAVLGYALVSDVTQAQKVCNTLYDCSIGCGAVMGFYSRVTPHTTRYELGLQTLECGTLRIYVDSFCFFQVASYPWSAVNVCR